MSENDINIGTDSDTSVTCATCRACCCKLEVMLMGDDDIPPRFTIQDPWGGWIMRRLDDGWCAALDRPENFITVLSQTDIVV